MNLAVSGNLFRAKCKCQELFNNDETETETNRTTSQGKTASTAFLFSVEETLTQVPGEAKWPPRGVPDHVARPPRRRPFGGGNKREVRTTRSFCDETERRAPLIWYAPRTVRVSPSVHLGLGLFHPSDPCFVSPNRFVSTINAIVSSVVYACSSLNISQPTNRQFSTSETFSTSEKRI